MSSIISASEVPDRYASQLAASDSAGVEDLALKTYQLIESEQKLNLETRERLAAENEIKHLKSVIETLELSVESFGKTCASLSAENEAMKSQVTHFFIFAGKSC